MSDVVSGTPAVSANRVFNPVKALAAAGDPFRWQIVKMLAGGRGMSATEIAAVHNRKPAGVAKHLRVLLDGGIIAWKIGEDRRTAVYFIWPQVRKTPGILDYNDFTLRLPEALGLNGKD